MPKDFLGNDINEGDYFAYPLTAGRSANMAIFQYKGMTPSGGYRGRPVERSYGNRHKYEVFEYVPGGESYWRDMTPEERAKVDAKTSTLHFLDKRAVKLEGFKEE